MAAVLLLVALMMAGCAHKAPFVGGEGEWHVAAFGSQRPSDRISLVDGSGKSHDDVLGGAQVADIDSIEDISSITFEAGEQGRVSDNDDGCLILYTTIDPLKDNFRLSATFKVMDVGERAGSQTGFGVCATDLAGFGQDRQVSSAYRYYNSVSCLAMDALGGLAGMRGVHGYIEPDASDPEIMRRCNMFEEFERDGSIEAGAEYRLELEKTDEGFTGRFGDEELSLADEGFVAVQDDGYACVGIFAARDITVEVTDVEFETSPAGADALVRTAKDIDKAKPAYAEFGPADERPIDQIIAGSAMAAGEGEVVCVSPDGKPDGLGTSTYPLDLAGAVASAEAGQTLLLKPGVYPLDEVLSLDASGTEEAPIRFVAAGDGTATFAGHGIEVAGDWWHLRGIEVADTEGVGMLISGSDNVIERCETHACGDTGLQITSDLEATEAELRETRDEWPARNLVINCDSHDNCDKARQDADGFAAKLSCGEGNVFYGCVAHHNIDDGWDLYSKAAYGPIGAVRIENCVSYDNGRTMQDEVLGSYAPGEGKGFKLGGADVWVEHVLSNSVAAGNLGRGITSNGAPATHVSHCTAYDNEGNYWVAFTEGEADLRVDDIVSVPGPSTESDDVFDGAIVNSRSFTFPIGGASSGNAGQDASSRLKSIDASSIARDPESGDLSLNGAFESHDSSGAHF